MSAKAAAKEKGKHDGERKAAGRAGPEVTPERWAALEEGIAELNRRAEQMLASMTNRAGK